MKKHNPFKFEAWFDKEYLNISATLTGMLSNDPIYAEIAESIIILKKTCKDDNQFKEATEYIKTSAWSSANMVEFISMTGVVPPDGVKNCPNETILTIRYLGV